jgi:hypothetical protein
MPANISGYTVSQNGLTKQNLLPPGLHGSNRSMMFAIFFSNMQYSWK